MKSTHYIDLGKMPYKEAWDYQQKLFDQLVDRKKNGLPNVNYLLFVEHFPVYTLGKSGSMENLLLNEAELKQNEIDFFKINRGGDITYHGPGQIVVYPVFDLDHFKHDIRWLVHSLEESVIKLLLSYGISTKRISEYTGVWIGDDQKKMDRKICAVGIHISKWVSMHGIAFNVNTDLSYFENIVPCGISPLEKSVTSMQKELGKTMDFELVKTQLKTIIGEVFELEYLANDSEDTEL